jgi:CheY-like chemotaxis protein
LFQHPFELAIRITPSELSTAFVGDPVRLRQILVNLIGNSIKFTKEGGVTIVVIGESKTETGLTLRFEVHDTGIGLSQQELKKLFRPFIQADNSTTRKFGGSGLGLFIVKRLVDLMNGSFGLDSELGRGSMFWFEIKLGKQESALQSAMVDLTLSQPLFIQESLPLEVNSQQSSRFAPTTDSDLAGNIHILVVEDFEINQDVILEMLNNLGFIVDLARNGREAVDMSRDKRYDLIFMDLHMPEMDGHQATAAIREREQASRSDEKIPIVAVTADAMVGDQEKCLASGMNGYLSKPFKAKDLHRIVKQWTPHREESKKFKTSEPFFSDPEESGDLALSGFINRERLKKLHQDIGIDITPLIKKYQNSLVDCMQIVDNAVGNADLVAILEGIHKLKSASISL